MASLIQVRDLLALRGRMEAAQISQTLNTPQPMINAMLKQLESMGKAVRIQEEPDGCLPGRKSLSARMVGVALTLFHCLF